MVRELVDRQVESKWEMESGHLNHNEEEVSHAERSGVDVRLGEDVCVGTSLAQEAVEISELHELEHHE